MESCESIYVYVLNLRSTAIQIRHINESVSQQRWTGKIYSAYLHLPARCCACLARDKPTRETSGVIVLANYNWQTNSNDADSIFGWYEQANGCQLIGRTLNTRTLPILSIFTCMIRIGAMTANRSAKNIHLAKECPSSIETEIRMLLPPKPQLNIFIVRLLAIPTPNHSY
jgi:hypothetical protein